MRAFGAAFEVSPGYCNTQAPPLSERGVGYVQRTQRRVHSTSGARRWGFHRGPWCRLSAPTSRLESQRGRTTSVRRTGRAGARSRSGNSGPSVPEGLGSEVAGAGDQQGGRGVRRGQRRGVDLFAASRAGNAAHMAKKRERGDRLTSPIGHARAVPIGDYGFLSDGEVSALLAPGGSVDWMCVPRFDSPSVFGSILGRRAGSLPGGTAGRHGAGRPPLPAWDDDP